MAGLLSAIKVSSQGLSVQRAKMNATAENIANAETTKTKEGGPYRRKRVVVEETKEPVSFGTAMKAAGQKLNKTNSRHISGHSMKISNSIDIPNVSSEEIVDPASSYRLVHDPSNPEADDQGYVKMPDVEIVNEMVDMMAASRAYEANTIAISTAKQMAQDALDI